MKPLPNPGSVAAQSMGCKCPVMDNRNGKGYYGDGKVFVYSGVCKVHKPAVKGDKSASKKD